MRTIQPLTTDPEVLIFSVFTVLLFLGLLAAHLFVAFLIGRRANIRRALPLLLGLSIASSSLWLILAYYVSLLVILSNPAKIEAKGMAFDYTFGIPFALDIPRHFQSLLGMHEPIIPLWLEIGSVMLVLVPVLFGGALVPYALGRVLAHKDHSHKRNIDMTTTTAAGSSFTGMDRRKLTWSLQWFRATFVGGTIGWLITAVLATFTFGAGLLAAGTITGIAVGLSQRRVLRELKVPVAQKWLSRTIVGATLGWFLAIVLRIVGLIDRAAITHPLLPLVAFLVGGFLFGSIQVRGEGQAKSTALWGLATGVGSGFGAIVGVSVALAIVPFYTEAVVFSFVYAIYVFLAGVLGMLILAFSTALALHVVVQLPGTGQE
jgi:hypothetical protein